MLYNMSMSLGQDLHAQAINAREKEQDLLKALKLTDEAIVASGVDNDSNEIAGIEGSRQNIFGHLYQKTGNKNYLILAKHAAMVAVEITEENKIAEMALPYRDLAKAYEQLGDFQNSVVNY